MNATSFLKGEIFGMPRWVWVSLLAGGVGVGLYLRTRPTAADTEQAIEEPSAAASDTLAYYEGSEQAGGLSAAGLVGPAGGAVVPVQTPYLPEGLEGIFASLAELATSLGATVAEIKTVGASESLPITGGGPPNGEGTVNTPPPAPEPKPKPVCSVADVNTLKKAKNEIDRLQGEINGLQNIVQTRTAWIQAHPNAKDKQQWINERNQAQANIEHKRGEVNSWSDTAQKVRSKPGCGSVSV